MKTILLTGANGAIGQAILNKFHLHNYQVIAPTRSEMNLADPLSIKNYMENLQKNMDGFIHCAGFNAPKSIHELTHDDIVNTMQINTFSFYDIISFLLPQFKSQKSAFILGVSSIYGSFSRAKRLAYATSKHALNGMIKTLAIELGPYNIKVNGIAPGFVDTKMTRQNNTDEMIENFKSKIPLRTLALTTDIANACFFLCSEENTYINGEILTIDGGYSCGGFEK